MVDKTKWHLLIPPPPQKKQSYQSGQSYFAPKYSSFLLSQHQQPLNIRNNMTVDIALKSWNSCLRLC